MACEAQYRLGTQERIALQALHFFNAGRQGQPEFGLVEVLPTARSNSTLRTLVRFRIKETVCLSGRQQQPPQQCAFRDGGEERNCTSAFRRRSFLSRLSILLVDCSPGPERQQEDSREQPTAPPPEEEAASDIDRSKLPPVVRGLYDNARNDIINNILRNF
ncbi:15 kDa protein A [Myotis brandtii]|uniref:15 kDa protein A n=2 Tax=Myotis brandtii TaxID=109478 RepID=S7PD76_MYOBR|nr:15 kDa protein A [Myotis brandtii]